MPEIAGGGQLGRSGTRRTALGTPSATSRALPPPPGGWEALPRIAGQLGAEGGAVRPRHRGAPGFASLQESLPEPRAGQRLFTPLISPKHAVFEGYAMWNVMFPNRSVLTSGFSVLIATQHDASFIAVLRTG